MLQFIHLLGPGNDVCLSQGTVIVIRGEGPKGGPGMPEMLTPTSAVIGAGLGKVTPSNFTLWYPIYLLCLSNIGFHINTCVMSNHFLIHII
jgi:hypothetical protein